MSTETITFGKKSFITVDGTVTPAQERKLNKKNIALEKARVKVDDEQENALRVATYLTGKADDVSLWEFIGSHPIINLRRTTVVDPIGDDNIEDFTYEQKDKVTIVSPMWFASIAKEFETLRKTVANYFHIPLYDTTPAKVTPSECFETMYHIAKNMGLQFTKTAFRSMEVSFARLKMDEYGNSQLKPTNLDEHIIKALRLSAASVDVYNQKLAKKYGK